MHEQKQANKPQNLDLIKNEQILHKLNYLAQKLTRDVQRPRSKSQTMKFLGNNVGEKS
jgi:hypothetical protein